MTLKFSMVTIETAETALSQSPRRSHLCHHIYTSGIPPLKQDAMILMARARVFINVHIASITLQADFTTEVTYAINIAWNGRIRNDIPARLA